MSQPTPPVAFFIFNRPEPTRRVFAAIRRAQPSQLLLVADGPRPDRPGEVERCAAARAMLSAVDWPCEVLTNFSQVNLGCRARLSSGLDWVFSTVEEAIILEDDCLPHPDFFPFCAELLERYRDDERIMHIGGVNFQSGHRYGPASYFFSRYTHIWGWASWRRAWQHYDVTMSRWPAAREQVLAAFESRPERQYWQHAWEQVFNGKLDTWDYQWSFACAEQGGLVALPNVNLVSNIGFGPEALHTKVSTSLAAIPTSPLTWPLQHPPAVIRNVAADGQMRNVYHLPGLLRRAIRRLARTFAAAKGRQHI